MALQRQREEAENAAPSDTSAPVSARSEADAWASLSDRPPDPDGSAAQTNAVPGTSPGGNPTYPEPTEYCYPLRIPSRLTQQSLRADLVSRIIGRGWERGRDPSVPSYVVWRDAGDEVVVHLDSFRVNLLEGAIIASLDLECDQTGRTPMVCQFATGIGEDTAGLLMTTDDLPKGNGLLASRWGEAVQNAIWSALLEMAAEHAQERQLVPVGLHVSGGVLMIETMAELPQFDPKRVP
jgi:hypothetical protein